MSEDDGHESGCDTVEGSPTSDTSTSPRVNNTYRYLDNSNHNNHPPLAAMVAPLPSPAVQGRSPRGVRTMVVPPMRVQHNSTQGTDERVQRMGQWECLPFQQQTKCVCLCTVWLNLIIHMMDVIGEKTKLQIKLVCIHPETFLNVSSRCHLSCGLSLVLWVSALQVVWKQ